MKRVIALILALSLCGCIADQKKQAAACELDAMRTYPNKTLRGASPSMEMADFIQACMRAAGYDFTCAAPYFSLSGSYACYEPSSPGGKWAYQIEKWLVAHGI